MMEIKSYKSASGLYDHYFCIKIQRIIGNKIYYYLNV